MNKPRQHQSSWCVCWFLMVLCLSLYLPVNGQTYVEYFWNDDPGLGNATKINTSDEIVNFTVSTASLPYGYSTIGYRTIRDGYWSSTYFHTIYKADGLTTDGLMEYFWDEDPGLGNAQQTSFKFNNGIAELNYDYSTSGLAEGIHILGMRVKGEIWSPTIYRTIGIVREHPEANQVEYFWDNDPGIGNATNVGISPDSDGNYMLNLQLDTDTLSDGIHVLGMRVASGGLWSTTYTRYIAVTRKGGHVEKVEYYWDDDPGHDLATELTFTGDTLAVVNAEIEAPSDYGTHVLHIRAKANGVWSSHYIQKFCMNATPMMELPKDTFCVGEQFIVVNASEGATDSTTYAWDMNADGTVDETTDDMFVYAYTKPGTYMATLKAKTVGDCETTCFKEIVVLTTDNPKVTLSASTKTGCEGESIRLKATATNAGDHPRYIWLLNDKEIAETEADSLWIDTLMNKDKVQVRVVSSNPCCAVDNALSSAITFTIKETTDVSLPTFFPVFTTESAFILSGGEPTGGKYLINSEEASLFNPKKNTPGVYQLTYRYTNANGCTSEVSTTLTLNDGSAGLLLGDANKDGVVDSKDVDCEIELAYGLTSPTLSMKTADINSDSESDVRDVVGVCAIINEDESNVPSIVWDMNNSLTVTDTYADKIYEVNIPFSLTMKENICGVQFDLLMPDGVELTSETDGLTVRKKLDATDNTYTVIYFASDLQPLAKTLNIKATLPINMAKGAYELMPTNVIMTNEAMQSLDHNIKGGSLYVGMGNSINTVNDGIHIAVESNGIRLTGCAGTVVTLTDTAGRFILAEEVSDDTHFIGLTSISSGVYIVEVNRNETICKRKFLWK